MVMKLLDAFQEFLNYATLERYLEPTTIEWYQRCMKPLAKYLRYKMLGTDVDVLTTENLRQYFITHRHNGNSPRSVINYMQGIKSFCNFLVKRKILEKHPFLGLEKPKVPRMLPEFLNEDETKILLQTCINLKREYKSRYI